MSDRRRDKQIKKHKLAIRLNKQCKIIKYINKNIHKTNINFIKVV